MKIIRPQQLIIIKNYYQIGCELNIGISVIAGCYLSKPNHFTSEAQIWDAWKNAPLSFPVLDAAEPKPFAEYILAGNAGIGQPVQELFVSAKVDTLSRFWKIEGERKDKISSPAFFINVPLDHQLSWGGKENKDNPMGKDDIPQLMNINENGEFSEYHPLAAPTPVPHEFISRKKYIDQIADQISEKNYLETIFPGFPSDINRRYFQMAPEQQWYTKAEWPENIPFEFHGVGGKNTIIKGELPPVQARAFLSKKITPEKIEPLSLQRKTLWFLPDNDMALIIFTGQIPIEHPLDDSIESIIIGLDHCSSLRSTEHFLSVKNKRSDKNACPFEFIFDPDLMPQNMELNVIQESSDLPSSFNYNPLPSNKSNNYYKKIKKNIDDFNKSDIFNNKYENKNFKNKQIFLSENDILLIDDFNNKYENKNFKNKQINYIFSKKIFLKCSFLKCNFENCIFENCIFENCIFENVNFNKTHFKNTDINNCNFSNVNLNECLFFESKIGNLTSETSCFFKTKIEYSSLENSKITTSSLISNNFFKFKINNIIFNKSKIENSRFKEGEILKNIFVECQIDNVENKKVSLIKNSIISGSFKKYSFIFCFINSMTAALSPIFNYILFNNCNVKKVSFQKSILTNSNFLYSNFEESNFDNSNLTYSIFSYCDMPETRFSASDLKFTSFKNTSLMQSMLYNADIRNTNFDECNLALTNMAMITKNNETFFNSCLLERACWHPYKKTSDEILNEK